MHVLLIRLIAACIGRNERSTSRAVLARNGKTILFCVRRSLAKVIIAHSKLRTVLFLALVFVFYLFANQISRQPRSGFAPNSQGRRAWFVARTSLNVKIKAQRSRSPGTNTGCAPHHSRQRGNGMRSLQITSCSSRRDHSVAAGDDFGVLRVIYIW